MNTLRRVSYFSTGELILMMLAYVLMLILMVSNAFDEPLQKFAVPLYFQIFSIPVFISTLYRHDQYFLRLYSKIRYRSARAMYVERMKALGVEAFVFWLPLVVILLMVSISYHLPLINVSPYLINLLLGHLQLGVIMTALHLRVERYWVPIAFYLILIIDTFIASGFFVFDRSFFYVPLLNYRLVFNLNAYAMHVAWMAAALLGLLSMGCLIVSLPQIGFRSEEKQHAQ